jgi:F-type H+-transporting ATPase subunit gamma
MPNAQDIRRRIKSEQSNEQITKAMKMVAAARLRKAQEKAAASRPYTEKIRQVLTSVASGAPDAAHSLLEVREVKRVAYLILSADKGLAGAYSSNVIKEALPNIVGKDNVSLITVGRKARDYFTRRGYTIAEEYTGFSEKPTYQHAVTIARAIAAGFVAGTYDEIHLVYTKFQSALTQKPTSVQLLPMEDAGSVSEHQEYIFEPSAKEVLKYLLPQYLESVIYGALLQSAASELGARMTAMGAATDNAQELIAKLVLNYNKIRQATITREISEIVGGAEALK